MSPVARRCLLFVPTLALAAAFGWLSVQVLLAADRSALDWVLAAMFVLVMAWEGLVAVQVSLGFVAWLLGASGRSELERRALSVPATASGRSRTALVLPVFDEDADAVAAGIGVMRRSLRRLGATDDLDIHVLSDSRDPDGVGAEMRAVERLRAETDGPAVHYRHRADNSGRKAGNVLEFLERTRGEYDFMVVLDADSLMSGAAIRRLIRLMEDSGRVALIQTISFSANRMTLFARVTQFAVRLYAPLSLRGMNVWQSADGLYYGHNAIVRCEPFLLHARLPVLPGKPPLGGEILCHDVVEAALLRRAGWEVRILPDLEGTWEEMPTNVVDLLGRERRWCQGNLQHIRVLGLPGLTAGSRTHIAMGVLSYLMGPLWWAFVALAAVRALAASGEALGILAYGATEPGRAAAALLLFSLAVLLLPRILNVVRALGSPGERRGFGGAGRLLASVGLEQLFSAVLAPTLSLVTIRFTLGTFVGRVVGWDAQSRADRDVGWTEAARAFRLNVAAGALVGAAALAAGGWYGAWMAPTAIGLLLGPALASWSSRLGPGRWAHEHGLFLTTDETHPEPELSELRAGRADFAVSELADARVSARAHL